MRIKVLLCLIGLVLLFQLYGCIGPGSTQNATIGGPQDNNTQTSGSADGRYFLYDLGNPASPAVQKTIVESVSSPQDAHNVFGRVNLTVKECFSLSEEPYRSECLEKAALYLKDMSLCGNLSADYRAYCYYEYAAYAGNASACGLIDDASAQAMCKRRVAIITGDSSLCGYAASETDGTQKAGMCRAVAGSGKLVGKERCREDLVYQYLVEFQYFGDTIYWLSQNHSGEKVLSWWDYGTALECMGVESVVSEDDLNGSAVTEAAHLLVASNESELASYMRAKGAKYLMLPTELVASSGELGGKYGALNYLSCVWENKTDAGAYPGESDCESEHLWEEIFISSGSCNVSDTKDGFLAYKLYYGSQYQANYPSFCLSPADQQTKGYCSGYFTAVPAYCVAKIALSDGQSAYATYSLDEKNSDGSLKLHRTLIGQTYHFGDVQAATLFYTHDEVFPGGLDSFDERTMPFYDSILYKGLFLYSMEGFQEVYTDPTESVTVYELSG